MKKTDSMGRVLFLSITAGQGHNSASKAVAGYLQEQGAECKILDTYTYLNKIIGKSYDKGYTVLARYNPKSLEKLCAKNEKVNGTAAMKRYFPFVFADLSKKKMSKYIERYQPDVIVCPHVLTCILITQLRKDGLISRDIPCLGIITDYTLHIFWENMDIDYFVTGADFMTVDFARKGIPAEKILPFGIPVQGKFEQHMEKSEARKKLALKDMETILVLSGGMGMGKMAAAVKELVEFCPQFQVVVVCGSNQTMEKKLKDFAADKENVLILGYTTNIDEYMDAADLVYTKPGGLTTTEALTKDKPLMLMSPLPGVEEANLAYFSNHSLACFTNTYMPGSLAIELLLADKERLETMRIARQKMVKHNSAKNLGDYILNLIEEKRKG